MLDASCGSVPECQLPVFDVLAPHALEVVEPGCAPGRHRREDRDRGDEIRQLRGTREGVRPAARDSPHRKSIDPERIGDRAHVQGAAGH